MALLALQSVSKSYGALKVTDNITLSVNKGETLGILGPNGAGKTTLMNVLLRFYDLEGGQIRIDDDGFVWIDGRKKHLLITAYGRNVSPEWVETTLRQQPALLQAVDTVMSGQVYLSPALGSTLLRRLASGRAAPAAACWWT